VTPDIDHILDDVAGLVAEHELVDGDLDALEAAPEEVLVRIEQLLASASALVAMYRRLEERRR
jgi:hypothetical protein